MTFRGLVPAAVLSASLFPLEPVPAVSPDALPSGNGDVNGDGKINLSDAIYLLDWLYKGGEEPVQILVAPDPPLDLHCSLSGLSVDLAWKNPEAYDAIEISRNGQPLQVLTELETGYRDPEIGQGQTFDYVLRGIRGKVASAPVSCEVVVPPPLYGPCIAGSERTGVDVIASKVQVLRKALERPDKDWLDSELRVLPSRLEFISRLDGGRILTFETVSQSVLAIDDETGTVQRVLNREELTGILNVQIQKPVLAPAVLLDSGWVLIYEATAKSVFGIRPDLQDPTKFKASLILTPKDLLYGVFLTHDEQGNEVQRLPQPWPIFTVKSMVKVVPPVPDGKDHVLFVPNNEVLAEYDSFSLETVDGSLEAEFPDSKPFLDFRGQVSPVTQNDQVDLKDFTPVPIPGTSDFLLFDRALDTSGFLVLSIAWGKDSSGNPALVGSVEAASTRAELVEAIRAANPGSEPFEEQFRITSAFIHPERPWIVAFEESTGNLVAYDFQEKRLGVFCSAAQLAARTDLTGDPDPLPAAQRDLLFAAEPILDHVLAFDRNSLELLGIDSRTGQVVCVLNRHAISAVTETGIVNIRFLEVLDPPPGGIGNHLRVIDAGSTELLGIRVGFLPVSGTCPP